MSSDRAKTKQELIAELVTVRARLAKLEVRNHDSPRDREALEESERRYRSVIDTAGSVILCIDTAFRIVEWNRAAERLFGRSRAEVLGQNYVELFLPGHIRDAVAADITKVLAGHPTEGFVNTVLAAHGEERLLLWNVSRLVDASGTPRGIVAIGQDITERTRAENERRRLELQLHQAGKLESLELLAGGIAHEFNQLLTRILASAARVRVMPGSDATTHDLAAEIEQAARGAIDIANQMLTYSGERPFDVYALFLNRQLEEIGTLLQAVTDKGVRLEYHLAPDLPPIMAHPGHLQQMIINLVTNASEAQAAPGGVVTILTGVMHADAAYLERCYLGDTLSAGDYVFLEVVDTGVGMNSDVQERMFDPFFSTNVPRRGLGLAAVLGIVRGHAGAINVTSAPGAGTKIRVLFWIPPRVPFASGGESRVGER